jgi:plastocyanin
MRKMRPLFAVSIALGLTVGPAQSADLVLEIADRAGKAAANAVVVLDSVTSAGAPSPAPSNLARRQTMDQAYEDFVPLVLVVPKGGDVVFTNSDTTRHHVYSFSQTKSFELIVGPGGSSPPVTFDREGVAAIGCNIHDYMVAHIYVTDRSLAAVSKRNGRATFADLPEGSYRARLWHPRMRPGSPEPTLDVTLKAGEAVVPVTLDLLPEQARPRDRERVRY